MTFQLASVLLILFLSAVLALGLAAFSWQRRHAGVWAYPFTLVALAASWWAIFYALELFTPFLDGKIIWAKFQYVAIVVISVLWFLFAMAYTERQRWLQRWRILLLLIMPCLTLIFAWTNEYHGQIWQDVQLIELGSLQIFEPNYGRWFWIHSLYSYLILFWGTVVLFQAAYLAPKTYRWQNLALAIGAIIPWLANALYLFDLGLFPNIDLSPVAFALSGVVLAWSAFRFHLFDVVPIARRAAVDMMQDGMIVLDNKNRVIDMNPAAMAVFGKRLTDVIGITVDELLADWPEILTSFKDVLAVDTEIYVEDAEGKRYFSLQISPLLSVRKRVNGRLIVFHDITGYKQTEVALAEARDRALDASRVKTELLARVSHELRTPLNVILGFAEMIQLGISGSINEDQYESLEKILESTYFLTDQVNDLLNLSSIEAGKTELNYRLFSVDGVIAEVIGKCQEAVNGKDLQIVQVNSEKTLGNVYGAQEGITQILMNLVKNAIKFSEQGTIEIGAFYYDEQHWALQVSDQGPGIPQEARDLIFEPFRQIDGSMTRIHGGTGLGLAIVKQMVELMGGIVQLESQIGEGSTFTVLLPNEP